MKQVKLFVKTMQTAFSKKEKAIPHSFLRDGNKRISLLPHHQ
jgi:hypothetical protein